MKHKFFFLMRIIIIAQYDENLIRQNKKGVDKI